MSYLVLARRWRPQKFDEVIGQAHVSQTLKNALISDRLAQGFLFTGTRGVGKTSVARILAKAINCLGPLENAPCNECSSCNDIDEERSVDIQEIDGASNTGVENVRELRDNARYLPANSKYKVYIIDEVHMLSKGAFNALLKILEEPPAHVIFIFATTEVHKVPATILSRCQRYDFRPIPTGAIADHLRNIMGQDNIELDDGAAAMLARAAKGSMRDSLSLLDQTIAFAGEKVAESDVQDILGMVDPRLMGNLASAVISGNGKAALDGIEEVAQHGHDWRLIYSELMNHFRNLIVLKVDPSAGAEHLGLSQAELVELTTQADNATSETLQLCLQGLLDSERMLRSTTQPRFSFELALLKLCHMTPVVGINDILTKMNRLKPDTTAPAIPAPGAGAPTPVQTVSSDGLDDEPTPPANEGTAANTASFKDPMALWPQFLASLKGTKAMLGASLGKTKPFKVENAVLYLNQDGGYNFLDDADNRKKVESWVADYFERPLKLQLMTDTQQKKKIDDLAQRQKLERQALNHPTVKAAVELFGGRPVKVAPLK